MEAKAARQAAREAARAAAAAGELVAEDALESSDEEESPERDGEQMTENTPEVRTEMQLETAASKKKKEDEQAKMRPKERDYDKEHQAAKDAIRRKEEESGEREVMQKNEGRYDFSWDETKSGNLELEVSRHIPPPFCVEVYMAHIYMRKHTISSLSSALHSLPFPVP